MPDGISDRFFREKTISKKIVIVTGGAGYIGSHTCKVLSAYGYLPVTIDNLSTGYRHNVKWGPFELGNVADGIRMTEIIKKYSPVACIHFAGSAYVGESMSNPEKYYSNNVVATLCLLKVLRREGLIPIIFSSSCATYGVPDYLPIDEAHPQRPISPYGFSKYVSEQMIIQYGLVYKLRYGILRYFNAAGADSEGDLKEEHVPETHLIPLALASAFDVGPKLKIYGTDYPTRDGTCVRDYIHVTNLAERHVDTLERLISGPTVSEIRNIGSGRGFSVKEILSKIQMVTGREVPVEFAARRIGDPPELWTKTEADFLVEQGEDPLASIIKTASHSFVGG